MRDHCILFASARFECQKQQGRFLCFDSVLFPPLKKQARKTIRMWWWKYYSLFAKPNLIVFFFLNPVHFAKRSLHPRLGGGKRTHPGHSQHFQRVVGLSHSMAHFCHHGSSNVRR
jgi:hypothetical protein